MPRRRRTIGDVVAIPLESDWYGFGRVLDEPLIAFYDCRHKGYDLSISAITQCPVLFSIWVMNKAVTQGIWQVIGNMPVEAKLSNKPWFYKKDLISGKLYKTRGGTEEILTIKDDCVGLESAAVWSPEHVVDRLNDHFAGRPNKWVKSLSLDSE
jgi:hypothetical protein